MKRQILSLLALALLAGCARAPSSTLRENANGFSVRMDTAWVRRMETLDKARSLLLGFQGLRDARALGLAPQREDREGRDRAEDLGRSLDSLRRLHATSRWCLLCGTAADSTVEITRAVRLPESAPFPDSLASCYGVAGQEMDGWLKHTRKKFSDTTIPWRGIHLGGWIAWGEVTPQRILHASWPKLPEDTAALVLEAPSFCRLEQLIARVPDAQCTEVSDGGSLQLGLLGGLEGGPERINCTFNDDGYPRGVLEDWMEIHELVNHAYCLKEKSADQCPVPKRRIP